MTEHHLIADLARRVGVLETEAKQAGVISEVNSVAADLRKWLGGSYSRMVADEIRPMLERLEVALGRPTKPLLGDEVDETPPARPPADKPMPVDRLEHMAPVADDEVPF